MKTPVYLNDLGITCALGASPAVVWPALVAGKQSGLADGDELISGRAYKVMRVDGDGMPLSAQWAQHNSRNNRLLLATAQQLRASIDDAVSRYGKHRVGVVIGTSTSGVSETVTALQGALEVPPRATGFSYRQQEVGAPAVFLADYLQLEGPAYVVSTACSSSARAMASARRLIVQGQVDAVVVGGVDTLAGLTLAGFGSLELLSDQVCNPFSRHRGGLNIGEGAALFVMSRDPGPVRFLGMGTSSDAHHMSAPHPDGRGAIAAMRSALADAGVSAQAVDYVNLHGTATVLNDAMEARAMAGVFEQAMPLSSSTKPMLGHTLGAAGAIEAAVAYLTLSSFNTKGQLAPHVWDGAVDASLPEMRLATQDDRVDAKVVMSNSFGFGGTNVSLILGRS